MGITDTPSRVREIYVGGTTFFLRRPDRTDVVGLIEELERIRDAAEATDSPTLASVYQRGENEKVASAALAICARDEGTKDNPEPVLTQEQALEWAVEAQIQSQSDHIFGSDLVSTCLRLCGLGHFVTGKARR